MTRIYYAFLISMQTDTYGAIPLEYYVKGAMPTDEKVKYMDQKDVYDVIFKMLDQAITALHNTPSTAQYSLGENDKCFGGGTEAIDTVCQYPSFTIGTTVIECRSPTC